MRVFNPYAPSNRTCSTATCYRHHKCEKRCKYEEWIRERELTSLYLLSCHAQVELAHALPSSSRDLHPCTQRSTTPHIALLRCRLSFALLWSSITCLRSVRSSFHNPSQIDLGTSGNSNQAMSNVLMLVHLYAHVAYSLVLWACQL